MCGIQGQRDMAHGESKVSRATGSPIPCLSLAHKQPNEALNELPGVKVLVDHTECGGMELATHREAGNDVQAEAHMDRAIKNQVAR